MVLTSLSVSQGSAEDRQIHTHSASQWLKRRHLVASGEGSRGSKGSRGRRGSKGSRGSRRAERVKGVKEAEGVEGEGEIE